MFAKVRSQTLKNESALPTPSGVMRLACLALSPRTHEFFTETEQS